MYVWRRAARISLQLYVEDESRAVLLVVCLGCRTLAWSVFGGEFVDEVADFLLGELLP